MLAFIHHTLLCLYHHHPLLTEILLISAHQILRPNVITKCSEIQVLFSPQRMFCLRPFFVVVFKILIYISSTSYFCFTAKILFVWNWCQNYTYEYSNYIYGIWSPRHSVCHSRRRILHYGWSSLLFTSGAFIGLTWAFIISKAMSRKTGFSLLSTNFNLAFHRHTYTVIVL